MKNRYKKINKDTKIVSGPGLFEALKDSNPIPYSPGEETEREYKLTEEEEARFDSIEASKEDIETAKKVFIKLKGPQKGNSIDELVEQIEQLWMDRVTEREMVFGTNKAGRKLFEDMIKREFGNI